MTEAQSSAKPQLFDKAFALKVFISPTYHMFWHSIRNIKYLHNFIDWIYFYEKIENSIFHNFGITSIQRICEYACTD